MSAQDIPCRNKENFDKAELLIKLYYTNKEEYLFTTSTNKQMVNENFEEIKTVICLKLLTMSYNCPSSMKIFHNIGYLYQKHGKLDLALQNYEKALTLYRNHGIDHSQDISATHDNMGGVYFEQHKFKDALHSFEQAIEEGFKLLPDNHSWIEDYKKNVKTVSKNIKIKLKID
ncbi:unnamed protein product [Didymodactylos carnosus]|uniref:Uncharacterized protein n=1 Tax=Didymodactylos carnosus TaxID=1234261 RepID=A0A815K6C2_9BILA|nr:unnamed protein product [Didymodactylos carnosus]CAF4283444.1 unnamed protein product [Didymodactylos carnosus]